MFKMNILCRMLVLLIPPILLTFLAFAFVSYLNLKEIYKETITNSNEVGDSTGKFTEEFAIKQARKNLLALVSEKSQRINASMESVKYDSIYIAYQMEQILAHPEKYKEITLPNNKDKEIYSGDAYTHFAPEIEENGLSEDLKHEIRINSNIVDMLKTTSTFYEGNHTSSYIASKKGYFIGIRFFPEKQVKINFSDEYLNTFDPRERPWYKKAEKEQKSVITDFYVADDGSLEVTFATPYYDKNGFAGVAAVSESLDSLYKYIEDDNIDNNVNFALNENGEVMLSFAASGTFAISKDHIDLRNSKEISIAKEVTNMASGKSDIAIINDNGKEFFLAYAPIKSIGWSFGTVIERDKVIKPAEKAKEIVINKSLIFNTIIRTYYKIHSLFLLLSFLIIILILLCVSIIVSKTVVKPILALTDEVKEIAKGNLDKNIEIKSDEETELLANSINNMTNDLKTYMENLSKVTAEKERIATELNVARNIQLGCLPSVEPNFSNKKEFDLAASMNPAKEVGGDFYDFYMLDENHLAVTIADVSDKGVGAALFMMTSKTVLKNCAMFAYSSKIEGQNLDLSSVIERANQQLSENNEEFMFVTVFFGVLDLITGKFSYVNAGHNPPLVYHKNEGSFSFIKNENKNLVIGFGTDSKYDEYNISLNSGDALFFYTDGITEAINENKELFGEKRLKFFLDRLHEINSAKIMLASVEDNIKKFVGNAPQSDDMTMLGLVYRV